MEIMLRGSGKNATTSHRSSNMMSNGAVLSKFEQTKVENNRIVEKSQPYTDDCWGEKNERDNDE